MCVKMPLRVSVEGVAAGSFLLGDLWNTLNLSPRHMSPVKTRAELGKKSGHGVALTRLPICSFGIWSPVWGWTRESTLLSPDGSQGSRSEGTQPAYENWPLFFPSYVGFKHRKGDALTQPGG